MHSENFPSFHGEPFDNGIMETVLAARYYTPEENSWDDVVNRVSTYLGDNIAERSEFKRLMKAKLFIPNSPCLMNAGTDNNMMSACFVLPIHDDLRSIMKTLTDAAIIFKAGGGVGINYSELRPRGTPIGSTHGTASGTVSFMEMFNSMSEVIKQGGKRRGAQMSILNFTHKDLYDFITVKRTEGKLNNMNLSVLFTDDDLNMIINHPETIHSCGKTYGELFDLIVDGIWTSGEPGLLFYSRINRDVVGYTINATNPCLTYDSHILTDKGYQQIGDLVGKTCNVWNGKEWSEVKPFFVAHNAPIKRIEFSNGSVVHATPDHKWFLHIDGIKQVKIPTCLLTLGDRLIDCDIPSQFGEPIRDVRVVSIEDAEPADVYCLTEPKRHQIVVNGVPSSQCGEMVLPPYGSCCLGSFDISKYVDLENGKEEFRSDVASAAKLLENIIIKNDYPIPEIASTSTFTHPRIGMGIMGYADLLLKKNIPYGSDEALSILKDILHEMKHVCKTSGLKKELESYLSIAPTGTISIFANCSSGIEPVFSWVYMRRNTLGKEFLMVHPIFDARIREMISKSKLSDSQKEFIYHEILNEAYTKGTIKDCPYLPNEFKEVFKCAMDITPKEHIDTQAAAQEIVDASISKTINLPASTNHAQIKSALFYAWRHGCKGLTMYRDGSRNEVVLDLKRNKKESPKEDEGMICPECGSKIERSEGCVTCHTCGWSKCL